MLAESQNKLHKTVMRPCIRMAMLRKHKTHPTATLAHRKNMTIHQSKFDQ